MSDNDNIFPNDDENENNNNSENEEKKDFSDNDSISDK